VFGNAKEKIETLIMEKAQAALDSVVDSVKNVATGEKKPKVKKPKGGDSGDTAGIHGVPPVIN
jgi:hypothetical protein